MNHRLDYRLDYLGLAARLGLGLTLVMAAVPKLRDPVAAVRAVVAYELLPNRGIETAVGHGLPIVELLVGALLLAGFVTRVTAVCAAALLAVFVGALLSAWLRGLSIDCGCFGGGGATEHPTYLIDLLRDLGLLGLAVLLGVRPSTALSVDARDTTGEMSAREVVNQRIPSGSDRR
jgi:uncharacterized membrane protein YphA (DoxX/SURF4 family)